MARGPRNSSVLRAHLGEVARPRVSEPASAAHLARSIAAIAGGCALLVGVSIGPSLAVRAAAYLPDPIDPVAVAANEPVVAAAPTVTPKFEIEVRHRVRIALDAGAAMQVKTADKLVAVDASSDVYLLPTPTTFVVRRASGRMDACSLTPTGDVAVDATGGAILVDGAPGACERLAAPDLPWRPSIWVGPPPPPADDLALLRMIYGSALDDGATYAHIVNHEVSGFGRLHTELVSAAHVEAVRSREPYLRVELDAEGADALCFATHGDRGRYLYLIGEGQPLRTVRIDGTMCDGVVHVPEDDPIVAPTTLAQSRFEDDGLGWQPQRTPDPTALDVPLGMDTSIATLGRYFERTHPDAVLRVVAIHDWVSLNITYDHRSLVRDERRTQDADSVFANRTGVCSGYAALMSALGEAAGVRIVEQVGPVDDGYHAWNAVQLDGKWYLVDATWDAATRGQDGVLRPYRGKYLFQPPVGFFATHR